MSLPSLGDSSTCAPAPVRTSGSLNSARHSAFRPFISPALRDGGSGHLIGSELEPTKAKRAREKLAAAGVADLVEIRVGDALETLKDGIDGDVDLVLLDGAFSLYLPVLKLLEPHLRDGAFVIGDNALERSGYLDYVRTPQNGYLSLALPFDAGRGNEFTVVTR